MPRSSYRDLAAVPDDVADIANALRRGRPIVDGVFDTVYPPEWRRRSGRFWTPVDVALRATSWLTEGAGRRVLDVGSGVGKLCIIGALSTDAVFVGLEQRSALVDVARRASSSLGVGHSATFVNGTIDDFDFSAFNAFYFYNPFAENLYREDEWLDATVELNEERYYRDVKLIESMLEAAPDGSRVVCYHGIGGRVPSGFTRQRVERVGTDFLRFWEKKVNAISRADIELTTHPIAIESPATVVEASER